MQFDLDTLFGTTVFSSAVAGGLLLLTWLQNRNVVALALWGTGFALGAGGLALITLRGVIPDLWSIVVGNAVLVAAYGIGWLGARKFEDRPLIVPVALAGAAVWLLACTIGAVYASPPARAALVAVIVVVYLLLSAWEFYRTRHAALMSRWPIVVILLVHAAIFSLRVPLAGTWADAVEEKSPLSWHVAVVLEAMLAGFCIAYLLGSMARERIVLKFQSDALVDPLTGVPNRRAFFEQGERLLRRVLHSGQPVAVLALDLDRFKTINDTFGHQAGDRVLIAFSEAATASLRPGDLFGRIGGEEFACILPNASREGAALVGERIRKRFAATTVTIGGTDVTATVSVGGAVADGAEQALADLVADADKALYRAKANGRDRVELAPARLVLVKTHAIAETRSLHEKRGAMNSRP